MSRRSPHYVRYKRNMPGIQQNEGVKNAAPSGGKIQDFVMK